MRISARNQLRGVIQRIEGGAVNCTVTIELPGGSQIVSMITKDSAELLGLKVGTAAWAVIKASSVMIAVD